jgi:hypothetical protein
MAIEVIDLRSRKRASMIVDPQNLNGQHTTPVVDRQPEFPTGLEIGSLFVKAQRFADETAKEAERKAQEVILAAEAIATLSASIEEFADASRTLAAELVKLRLALGESSAPAPHGQHLPTDQTALTSNVTNGEVLLPTSG